MSPNRARQRRRKGQGRVPGLTVVGLCHYIRPMDSELALLEDKVQRLLAHCESLFAENHSLRSRIAKLEGDRQRLSDRIETASQRLEDLMARIAQ